MKKLGMMVAGVAALALSGCAMAQSPVSGMLYTSVQAPLSATSVSGAARTGTSSCSSILGILATGDCSITTAARAGGITEIQSVDYESTNLLGLYATFTTKVNGN